MLEKQVANCKAKTFVHLIKSKHNLTLHNDNKTNLTFFNVFVHDDKTLLLALVLSTVLGHQGYIS